MNKQKIIWLVIGMIVGVGAVLGGVYIQDYLHKKRIDNLPNHNHNPGIPPYTSPYENAPH